MYVPGVSVDEDREGHDLGIELVLVFTHLGVAAEEGEFALEREVAGVVGAEQLDAVV